MSGKFASARAQARLRVSLAHSSSSAPPRSTTSTNFNTNTYSGLTCDGTPTASEPGLGGCISSVKVSCVTTTDNFPFLIYKPNSLVVRRFAPGVTCAAPGVPTSITVLPLDTCISAGTGGQKYSYNAVTGLLSATSYAAAGCSGAGVPSPTTQKVNGCLEYSSSPPNDFTCSTAAASPAPVITTPSSAFLPAPLSGSSEVTACKFTAQQSSGGVDGPLCGNLDKYTDFSATKPTMSVAVFNPFGRFIAIYQKRVSACTAGSCTTNFLPDSEDVDGKNSIASSNLWISLSNVPCQTPSNPYAYCSMYIIDDADSSSPHYWFWFREDSQLGAILVAAALVVIVGAIVGVIFACCCLWGALHAFNFVVCPCFNCCCDRRKRSVGGAGGAAGFSAPSYPISVQSSNPAAMGVAYGAQTYAPAQPQQAAPASSLTAKWDPSGLRHA